MDRDQQAREAALRRLQGLARDIDHDVTAFDRPTVFLPRPRDQLLLAGRSPRGVDDLRDEVSDLHVGSDDVFGDVAEDDDLDGGRHRRGAAPMYRPRAAAVEERLPLAARAVLSRVSGSDGVRWTHVLVVAVGVVVAAVAVAAWVVSSRPEEIVAEPVGRSASVDGRAVPGTGTGDATTGQAAGQTAGQSAGQTAPSAATVVIVDVTGKVRKPGIVTLPVGSRVVDAIKAAGGARKGADISTVNLARVLVDGEQIVVGLPAVSAPSGSGGASGAPGASTAGGAPGAGGAVVNLNTASAEQLDSLPQVGPVTAQAIIDWRTENGRFASVEDLLEVRGIGEATLARLRDLVTV